MSHAIKTKPFQKELETKTENLEERSKQLEPCRVVDLSQKQK